MPETPKDLRERETGEVHAPSPTIAGMRICPACGQPYDPNKDAKWEEILHSTRKGKMMYQMWRFQMWSHLKHFTYRQIDWLAYKHLLIPGKKPGKLRQLLCRIAVYLYWKEPEEHEA